LAHSAMQGATKDPGRIMFNFETAQVHEEFERIKALGAVVISEPYAIGEEWIATLADPDGNYFQLVTPMGSGGTSPGARQGVGGLPLTSPGALLTRTCRPTSTQKVRREPLVCGDQREEDEEGERSVGSTLCGVPSRVRACRMPREH